MNSARLVLNALRQGRGSSALVPRAVSSFTKFTPSSSCLFSRSSHSLSQHKDSDFNNKDLPFEWTEESLKKIEWVLKKFPKNYKQSGVIPLLYIAQEQDGTNWLPISKMNKVAETLDMPPIRVYEVASFYTMFNRDPVGKYHIQLCGTTPCMVRGSDGIMGAITKHLGIKDGETTKDGLFTVTEVECLGACVNAPMIQVNNKHFYEHLTPESMVQLLDDWKAGKPVKEGNQNGLNTCEGPMGKTALFEVLKPVCRDLDKLKADLEAEAKEK